MLNSFNFAIEHGVFHRDQKTSLISLLLKKGKDPLDCSSYRPISLIPCDLKIYAKVFASRMEKVIHSLIKEDQTGFIKGRNASDNMRRLLHILDFVDSHPTPCAVFSLDAEKAFDRLEWNYMWAVLQCFGFSEHFISMIKTLYHSPAASVITGNIISPPFPLQRGMMQGCPLSPLLFCLSLEPLAQANIHKIARDNFNNILVKVKNDIQRWKNLKVSLQGRISTVKMNLLPRLHFFFSMLPLSPPPGYFKEINSIISKFIWNDKCPRIKLTTLQHPNSAGGLAVPNFELYYWSFQLKALHNWVDPQSTDSWRVIEADKVKPNRLQDNFNFVCGNRPFVQPSWSSLGVNVR